MAKFLQATFTVEASRAVSGYEGEIGGVWGIPAHLASLGFDIASWVGRAFKPGTSVRANRAVNAVPATPDYSVTAELFRASTASSGVGIFARLNSSVATFYFVRFSDGINTWELYRFVGGTSTLLGSFAQSFAAGTSRVLKLICEGDQISVEVDGVLVIGPVTDTEISDAGLPGIRGVSAASIHGVRRGGLWQYAGAVSPGRWDCRKTVFAGCAMCHKQRPKI